MDRIQPLLGELTAALAPDRLCAALSRGATLDLEATLRELQHWAPGQSTTAPADVPLALAPGSPAQPGLQPLFAGRYLICKQLARGGMGAVYEARNVATERRVALKKLHPDLLANEAARQGFELEARVAARVASEHIVQVLDAGIDRDTQIPYLVMELLEGQTLETMLAGNQSLPISSALPLLEQLAKGLDAAHGYAPAAPPGSGGPHPIVHRDLEPENVFVSRRQDGTALVKLLDFGIAKVVSDSQRYTRDVRGTPLYMAYEQVTLSEISPQTDLWALGLITYRVLVGHHYWRSAELPSPSLPQLFAEIVALPLVPPSQRIAEQSLPVKLPRGFDDWLLRCLDRKQERRFPSAGATIGALAQVLPAALVERAELTTPCARPRWPQRGLRPLALARPRATRRPRARLWRGCAPGPSAGPPPAPPARSRAPRSPPPIAGSNIRRAARGRSTAPRTPRAPRCGRRAVRRRTPAPARHRALPGTETARPEPRVAARAAGGCDEVARQHPW